MKPKLMERAEEYVGLLVAGSEIRSEDEAYIADFRHLLKALLCKKGLFLHRRGDHEVVTTTPPWLLDRLQGVHTAQDSTAPVVEKKRPVTCMICGSSWFDCEHGVGATIVADRAQMPGLPGQGGRG